MRALVIAALAACGGSPSQPQQPDGGGDDDGGVIPPSCDAPAPFGDGLTPSRELHVARTAAPGGDGSAGAPFRTLEEAAAAATPGTLIRLAAGNHEPGQFVADLRGAIDAPIWIDGGGAAVFDGGGQAFQLQRPAFVIIRGIEVTGATANGINIDDGGDFADETAAHHLVLQDLFVHDIGAGGNNDCIKLSGTNDLAVYDSRIERCGAGGSGIDFVGGHRAIVARNTFDGAMATAVQAKGGSTDIDIRQNRIRAGGARAINLGGSTDLTLFRPPLSTAQPNAEARRIRVFANVITGLGADATPFAFVGCVDCLAAHNLARGAMRFATRVLQETVTQDGFTFEPASRGRVIANSFVFESATFATACNVGGNTDAASFTFAANSWHAVDATYPGPDLPSPETGGISGQGTSYGVIPDDPRAPIGGACSGPPEAGAGVAVDGIVGALAGDCLFDQRPIGPLNACLL